MVLLAYLLDDSLMWADFQVYIKDASFREEHFCHWNFRSISSHSWVVLILVRKPLEIMIHGPSSLFIGRLVAVSQVYIKDASFREKHFCHWNFRSISSHSWVILVRKPLDWLWSMVLLAYLLDDSLMWADFQVYIKDAYFREEHFCHWNFRSISCHSWVDIDLLWADFEVWSMWDLALMWAILWSMVWIGRCVDVFFKFMKLSLYLLSSWVVLFSWESLWSIFWLWSMVAYLYDDSLMWADFQVYIKDASFREEHFCHWNFRSISSHSWVVLILVRKPLDYFLIMIHGPSSLFICDSLLIFKFSSVFSREKFLSLKLSLYLLSFLSCIDSREKALDYFLIMIHSSLFIGRLVDVSWFSSLYKRCVFSRGTFLSLKLSLYLLMRKPLDDYDPWSF